MKKSSSKSKYGSTSCINPNTTTIHSKHKTASSVVHTEVEPQRTTKKNSISKGATCSRVPSNISLKPSTKMNLLRIQGRNSRIQSKAAGAQQETYAKNQKLSQENAILKEQFCKLQQAHLKDKAKIQTLIGRLSEIKSVNSQSRLKTNTMEVNCQNQRCQQRKRQLELQLHRERMKVQQLTEEKKTWEKNQEHLKNQYKNLLGEIHRLREDN